MKNKGVNIWDDQNGKKLLLLALSLALITHGTIIYFTLPKTYDAFVHIFFADHYSRFWFEPWEYRWYTGFLTISYPPLVHQMTALLAKVFPLKVAFSIYAIFILEIFIIGVYRFSKLFFNKTVAGVAAIVAVLLSSIIETLHVYGQLPSLHGMAFLLNALPFLYLFIYRKRFIYLLLAVLLLSVVICSHHVTVIFGMVFFIAPLLFMALVDRLSEEQQKTNIFQFIPIIIKESFNNYKSILLFGLITIMLIIGLIYPYWNWSINDPIAQVSIPHGSRDNFFEKPSSGLIFYIIPLILILAFIPAISFEITKRKRLIGWVVSFFLCLLLGSGGTTPLPKLLLGEHAFNILTLDRFGFWASIIAIPFIAKFIYSFVGGASSLTWIRQFGIRNHFIISGLTAFLYLLFVLFVFHLGSFRPLQPKAVEIQPIVNFLNRDDHMRWRYLTLGFGDQMAWLSANSLAATVDGNYHSARRLPELTSRPVERLENAKFNGAEGLASLNDFLTKAEKYNLKYVFSNDNYYDPLLYFTGWNRTVRLENGIVVWEKGNISTIQPITPKELNPMLKYTWGIIPITTLFLTILFTIVYLRRYKEDDHFSMVTSSDYYPKSILYSTSVLPLFIFSSFIVKQSYELLLVNEQKDPLTTVQNYYQHLDFQRFEKAFQFFNPSPSYSLDQYLLEKSVNDGGLLPSYAKLDSISVKEVSNSSDTSKMQVYIKWRTSLGFRETNEIFDLVQKNDKWYIIPPKTIYEIPEQQIQSYTFTLFKKQGKRVISSFPTLKEDRITKPFAQFKQANLIRSEGKYHLTGEIINTDDIPINIALRAKVEYDNNTSEIFYPNKAFHYNLSAKASTVFQINLTGLNFQDSVKIKAINIFADTDASERGYIHGGTVGIDIKELTEGQVIINSSIHNNLITDISIPGILIAEKDSFGTIWQSKLYTHPKAVRSGFNTNFGIPFNKIQNQATEEDLPIEVFINGRKSREIGRTIDNNANINKGISIMSHCFMSKEIFFQ